MRVLKTTLTAALFGFIGILNHSCADKSSGKENIETTGKNVNSMEKFNPVVYFEIPVTDIDRAISFYKNVFSFEFEKETIDKNEMALFPFVDNLSGISGALAKGEIYKPTNDGTLIYFKTQSIDKTLNLVKQNGGHVLYPKTLAGELGFVAEFEDSEGNRIALHMSIER
jgi:uncharacterized protein